MKILNSVICFILVSILLASCDTSEAPTEIRNVIVIVGDDHSSRALGCYGNEIIRTPNIDRLASEGIIFSNAYSNAPVCSASRQSILTAKYPHSTGVTLLRTPFRDLGNITIAEHLRNLGYKTAIIGKTHFNNWLPPAPNHGFSEMIGQKEYKDWLKEQEMPSIPDTVKVLPKWKPFIDSARIWLNADVLPTAVYEDFGSAAFDARKAIEFLNANKDTTFFLWLAFHEPHSPFNFPVEYTGKYLPEDMQLPAGSEEDDRFVPEIFRDLSEDDKRGIVASYYTSVEYMDSNIGKILDEIDNLGLKENTLVVYLGDQGYLLGDHKRFEKHTMWDPAIKAPLIFRVGAKSKKTKRSDALVQFIDIVPTILDLIDEEPMSTAQGKSLEYLLNNRSAMGNEYAFAEFLEDNKAMITDGKWKYIYTTGKYDLGQGYETGFGPSGVLHKLYDLQNDPEESINIAEFPGNEMILASLQRQMLRVFKNTHPDAINISDTLSIVEQLAWFCEPRDEGSIRGSK